MVQALIGMVVLTCLGLLFSENRRKIDWKRLGLAMALQWALALLILKTSWGHDLFHFAGKCFLKLKEAHDAGVAFVFGDNTVTMPLSLALGVLPMIIFVSALSAVLYHYRILQALISFFALLFRRLAGMSGPEALGAAANIFMGMAEAPTLIAPYLKKITRAQLFMVMVAGMATISGSLLVVYANFIQSFFSNGYVEASAHLLAASVISAPAAFYVARLLVPEIQFQHETVQLELPRTKGFFDALSQGTLTGIKLTAYVVGMLIVMVALIKLVDIGLVFAFHKLNVVLNFLGFDYRFGDVTLSFIFGKVFQIPAWLMGIEWADCENAGKLLGVKVVANDFLAYLHMSSMTLQPRSVTILSYALCGFANFGSIGIMIASMAGLCPERRAEIAGLGLKAMWAGVMATSLTGMIVAII